MLPRQRVLPTRVEIDEKGSAGKSRASAAHGLREQTRVCRTTSGAAEPRCPRRARVTSPVRGACAHTLRNPPARFTSSSARAFLTGVSTNQQTPLQRKLLAFVSTSPFAKAQVGSYFHTTFVRSEVNRLHHSYLNLQKELVGSGQRVKNALMYLGALLYATSTATRLCWKG